MSRSVLLSMLVVAGLLVSIAVAWSPSPEPVDRERLARRSVSQNVRRVLDRGDRALSETLRVLAHNLTNVDTTAFKARYVVVEAADLAAGGGSRHDVRTDFRQGDLIDTQRPLDLAILGRGFFQVTGNDGMLRYTRRGDFALNASSIIVLRIEGREMMLDPPISIPPDATEIYVDHEGIVSVDQAGQSARSQIGQMQLALFVNAEGLRDIGGGVYEETDDSGAATLTNPTIQGGGKICQRCLEASNVDFERALTDYRETLARFEQIRTAAVK